jgi:predicted DNA-binding protein (MmcQ/YjbR family)
MSELKKKWGINTPATELKLQERKDALILLSFLNIYDTYENAMIMYKEYWLNVVYALPPTNDVTYKSVKQSRALAMRRVKQVFNNYIIIN